LCMLMLMLMLSLCVINYADVMESSSSSAAEEEYRYMSSPSCVLAADISSRSGAMSIKIEAWLSFCLRPKEDSPGIA
jgi:hypothetical protein